MTLSSFAAYIKQLWRNKPDTSTPVTAERLAHMEEGIKGNSDAIEEIAAAVVSQIINDPDKIASMAAVYAVNQKVATLDGKVGDTAQLPDGATDVVTAIAKQNSNLSTSLILSKSIKTLPDGTYCGASEVITIPGFYNIYKSPDSPNPDLRWIIREESAVYDSQWIHIQTAYSLQGSAFQIKQRMWTFAETGVGHWSEWL